MSEPSYQLPGLLVHRGIARQLPRDSKRWGLRRGRGLYPLCVRVWARL